MNNQNCFFTHLPTKEVNIGSLMGVFAYSVEVNQKKIELYFSEYSQDWVDDEQELDKIPNIDGTSAYKIIPNAIKNIKHIVRGLILNEKWNTKNYDLLTKQVLFDQLKYYDFPKTAEEKFDYLFNYLFNIQQYDGETLNLDRLYNNEWKKLFFKNVDEFLYYLTSLSEKGLIELETQLADGRYVYCTISFNGFLYKIELEKSGKNSNNCFVAMSFDDEDLKEIYEDCIYPLLKNELGFNPILIKDSHFKSDKTINDAMIAEIKKSKFIIADFTKQKRNVYFESGYAAGLGLKVIYTCKEEYFKNKDDINKQSAFDTNHFPHIIWKNVDDLKKQLKNKIEAYIL